MELGGREGGRANSGRAVANLKKPWWMREGEREKKGRLLQKIEKSVKKFRFPILLSLSRRTQTRQMATLSANIPPEKKSTTHF